MQIGVEKMKVIKLKKLINEVTSGLTKREFGDPLPTFKDVMEKHQADESDEKVSEVVKSTCPKCGHKY